MDNNNFFTPIEEQKEEPVQKKEENIENIFVTGLPDWDLEPPYETIKRGE